MERTFSGRLVIALLLATFAVAAHAESWQGVGEMPLDYRACVGDFVVAPLKKGESIRVPVFVYYTLRDGLISEIRVARSGQPSR